MGYTAAQIASLVRAGSGPESLFSGSERASTLAERHLEIAEHLRQLNEAMLQHWKGEAAGQAYSGAGPLMQASEVSGAHLRKARDLYSGHGDSFALLQEKVRSVEPLGEEPQFGAVTSSPLSFMGNIGGALQEWHAKNQVVVDAYTVYDNDAFDNSVQWPQLYGVLGLPPGGAEVQIRPLTPVQDPGDVGEPGKVAATRPAALNPEPTTPATTGTVPITNTSQPNMSQPTVTAPPPAATSPAISMPPASTRSATAPSVTTTPNASAAAVPSLTAPNPMGNGQRATTGQAPSARQREAVQAVKRPEPVNAPVVGGKPTQSTEVRMGRAGAAGSAAAGMAGAGPVGQAKRQEDDERRRPAYLLEHDPDEALVGELPSTPPPVIGL